MASKGGTMTTIHAGDNVRFTGELDPEWDGLGYSDIGRVLRLFEQCGKYYATAVFPAADERAGADMVTRDHLVSELVVMPGDRAVIVATCGLCSGEFGPQYPLDQYPTVRDEASGEWLPVCDDCYDEMQAA